MTITKAFASGTGTVTDNFLFSIKGQGKNSYIDLTVVITGNGSAVIDNLPIGDYTVTELTAWSWEYTPDSESKPITVVTDEALNKLTFTNTYQESDWLSGESGVADNDFGTPATP